MQGYVAILQQNPGNVDALYYVAMLALQQGQFAEGLKVIQRAIDLAPKQARLHNLKGQAHLRQNAGRRRAASFGRAIEVDPAFADAYGNRGTLLVRDGPHGGGACRLRPRAGAAAGQPRGPLQPGERDGRSRPHSTRRWRAFPAPSR